jgi:hypothetical protein
VYSHVPALAASPDWRMLVVESWRWRGGGGLRERGWGKTDSSWRDTAESTYSREGRPGQERDGQEGELHFVLRVLIKGEKMKFRLLGSVKIQVEMSWKDLFI